MKIRGIFLRDFVRGLYSRISFLNSFISVIFEHHRNVMSNHVTSRLTNYLAVASLSAMGEAANRERGKGGRGEGGKETRIHAPNGRHCGKPSSNSCSQPGTDCIRLYFPLGRSSAEREGVLVTEHPSSSIPAPLPVPGHRQP